MRKTLIVFSCLFICGCATIKNIGKPDFEYTSFREMSPKEETSKIQVYKLVDEKQDKFRPQKIKFVEKDLFGELYTFVDTNESHLTKSIKLPTFESIGKLKYTTFGYDKVLFTKNQYEELLSKAKKKGADAIIILDVVDKGVLNDSPPYINGELIVFK